MRIWRICRQRYAAEAFSGHGARLFGGRWNSPGTLMVYASSSVSLAAIELFVHLEPNQQPGDLVSIAAQLPAGEPNQRLEPHHLPSAWWDDDLRPLRELGNRWIREQTSLAIEVPSAAMRTEWNVLINPLHPKIAEIKIEPPQPFHFDARMFRLPESAAGTNDELEAKGCLFQLPIANFRADSSSMATDSFEQLSV